MNILGRENLSALISKIVQYLSDIFPLSAGWVLGWIFVSVLKGELLPRTLVTSLIIILLTFISALSKQTLRKVIESPAIVVAGCISQLIMGFPYDR